MALLPMFLVALALLASPSPAPHPAQTAEKAHASTAGPPNFTALRSGWVGDLQAKRLDRAISRYTPDATFTNPDGTHAEGAAAIRSLFTFVFTGLDAKIELTPRATGSSGDLAFDSGSYSETLTEVFNNTPHPLAGDYLTVYRREPDGEWRILQQVWTEARHR